MEVNVELPDDVVDTESNLNSVVLMKNLYKLGLNYSVSNERNAQINQLLGVRNAIAHGDVLKVPKSEEVDGYVLTAFEVMSSIQREIFNALKEGAYRRAIA